MPCIDYHNTQRHLNKSKTIGLDIIKFNDIQLNTIYKGNKRTYNIFKLNKKLKLNNLETHSTKINRTIEDYYSKNPSTPRHILIEFRYNQSGHVCIMFLYPDRIEFFDPSGFKNEDPLSQSKLNKSNKIKGTTLSDYIIFYSLKTISSKFKIETKSFKGNLNASFTTAGECALISLVVSKLRYDNSSMSFNQFQIILNELGKQIKSMKSTKEKINFLKEKKSFKPHYMKQTPAVFKATKTFRNIRKTPGRPPKLQTISKTLGRTIAKTLGRTITKTPGRPPKLQTISKTLGRTIAKTLGRTITKTPGRPPKLQTISKTPGRPRLI